MGGSNYSHDDYVTRSTFRARTGTPTFKHTADINTGKVKAGAHASLDPHGITVRESRDSDTHPVTVPIIIQLDTTGSMQSVPATIQAALPKLMGAFLDAKVSGNKYLGEGYPAILISANDDSYLISQNGAYQMGQFESGIEIDDNLTNLWLTGNGGGEIQQHECYQLGLYAAAYHTAHDHFEKRGKKGYMFIIGDEQMYDQITPSQVAGVFGETIPASISTKDLVAKVKERYHLFFINPNQSSYYGQPWLRKAWTPYVGEQFIELQDPTKICELIVSLVALMEGNDLDDLMEDNVATGLGNSLAVIAKTGGGSPMVRKGAANLPSIAGTAGSVKRL